MIEGKDLDNSYQNDVRFTDYLNSINYQCYQFSAKHSITNHDIAVSLCKSSIQNSQISFLNNFDFKWVDFEDIRNEFPSSISDKLKTLMKKYMEPSNHLEELPLTKMLALKQRFSKNK